jgi:hypothetical protein
VRGDILPSVFSTPDLTTLISVALAVALVLCACILFWTDKSKRAGEAQLILVGRTLEEGQSGNRWFVRNDGASTASDVQVEAFIPGNAAVPRRTFQGRLDEPLPADSGLPVASTGIPWAGRMNIYRDHPTERVWAGATAHATWTDSTGRAHSAEIPVHVPGLNDQG